MPQSLLVRGRACRTPHLTKQEHHGRSKPLAHHQLPESVDGSGQLAGVPLHSCLPLCHLRSGHACSPHADLLVIPPQVGQSIGVFHSFLLSQARVRRLLKAEG
nr:MAG TPA: hypothetical protein [Caudoviricetes sp.]